jgi:hypothetical protein
MMAVICIPMMKNMARAHQQDVEPAGVSEELAALREEVARASKPNVPSRRNPLRDASAVSFSS